jgi:hypothetical protein
MGQRNSAKRKAELVLRVLRGESLEEVSRSENVTIADLTEWRESCKGESARSIFRQR